MLIHNIRYSLRIPSATRKTWGLVKYTYEARNVRVFIPLNKEEKRFIDNVNDLYSSKAINQLEAKTRLNLWIQAAYSKAKTPTKAIKDSIISDYNMRIYNKFWSKVYEPKELVDSKSADWDFKRALRSIEPLPLDAPLADIKKKIDHLEVNKIKRIYARLNEIRRFTGVEEPLVTRRNEIEEPNYITIDELKALLSFTEDTDIKNAIATLFATGCRLGELLALSEKDLVDDSLYIGKQIRKDGSTGLPKRGKKGKVAIISPLKKYVVAFLKVKDKPALRSAIQNAVVTLSSKHLGRHIHAHDLRHSHAIYLLSKGANISLVALQLRNRIEICQKFYIGFEHVGDTLNLLKKLI